MLKTNKSYLQIIRSTGIFGGAQLANILIGITRNKLVAILLGTVGVGIISMCQSAIDVVKSISSLGLETTGVREIASVTTDKQKLSVAVSIILKWTFVLALIGALICILCCRQISLWAFDSDSYKIQVAFLSIVIFFSTLATGETIILQGTRSMSAMIKSSLIWNIVALIIALPLYIFLRINAIVLVFCISSVAMYLSAYYYRKKLNLQTIVISNKDVLKKGLSILKVGIFIVMAGIQSQLCYLVVKTMISDYFNLKSVGLYQAAWTITNVYFMLLLKSMGADFYPRLSKIASNRSQIRHLVNEQTYIVLIISTPLIIILLLCSKLVLKTLYSSEFLGAEAILHWQVFGAFFKVLAWPLGFVLLAKGKGLRFFISELVFSIVYLISVHYLLPKLGICAVGIGYSIAYLVYLLNVYIYAVDVCNFRWMIENLKMIFVCLVLILLTFYLVENLSNLRLIVGIPVFIMSVVYSLYKLNKVVILKNIFKLNS